jgi:hypothetical protein
MNSDWKETTRYLCTAAYLDKTFRDSAIQQIIKEEYKAIATSHEVDLLAVVKSCLMAAEKEAKRDRWLGVLFLIMLITNFGLFLPCYLIAYIIVFRERWTIYYGTIAKKLARHNFKSNYLEFNLEPRTEARLEEIAKEQNGNVIVYNGFSPFVGSGIDLGGWSFTLNLSQAKEEIGKCLEPIPFKVEELYEYIADEVTKLKLNGVTLTDKLCVNGGSIRENRQFLPDPFNRPSSYVGTKSVKSFVNSCDENIRYYKHIKVVAWSGDLVLSIFLRFLKIHEKLFVETNYFLLTPVKSQYRLADSIEPEVTFDKVRDLLIQSSGLALKELLLSPFYVLGRLINRFQEQKRRKIMRRIVRETPNFNYGAAMSVREIASSGLYYQHFQKLDKEMYLKIIERQIIDGMVEFLESKNIDTSELKERQNTIFNNGMIVSGGSVQATNLSVGENAKSFISGLVKSATSQAGAS